jgi:hydroxypyruvate reductase
VVGPQANTLTRSLPDLRHDLLALVRAGIDAAAAGPLVERALTGTPDGRYLIIAAGKAASAMAAAAARVLGERVRTGLVVCAEPAIVPAGFELIVGGHPVPTAGSEAAGRRALAIAGDVSPTETLLVLLSGGASALMAVPADGLTLDDKRAATAQLLRAGADIHALNTVRKHLSAIKGGQLASRVAGRCRTLVMSDVVGDDPSVIASGPTVGDESSFQDALEALQRLGGEASYPRSIVERLRRGVSGAVPETPASGDERLARARTTVIGSRRDAMAGVAIAAGARGYNVVRLDDPVVGEARTAAVAHLRAVLARVSDRPRPTCVVSSGETTVHVTGRGKGGRNQEFALASATLLAESGSAQVVLASVGTDGIDGPTDAAGALADATTVARAQALSLAPDRFLADNNAYAFFDALGDLIYTGPTGTNVGDLQIILLA